MSWTDERIQELTRLWQAGHSASEIGKRLGVSKNSIVGKAHRLKLPARPSPIKQQRADAGNAPAQGGTGGPSQSPSGPSAAALDGDERAQSASTKASVAQTSSAQSAATQATRDPSTGGQAARVQNAGGTAPTAPGRGAGAAAPASEAPASEAPASEAPANAAGPPGTAPSGAATAERTGGGVASGSGRHGANGAAPTGVARKTAAAAAARAQPGSAAASSAATAGPRNDAETAETTGTAASGRGRASPSAPGQRRGGAADTRHAGGRAPNGAAQRPAAAALSSQRARVEQRGGSSGCLWPIGDPGDADFHFCGAEPVPGKPYCAEHAARAYITRSRGSERGEEAA